MTDQTPVTSISQLVEYVRGGEKPADCFRIGNIGRIFEADVKGLLSAIKDVIDAMGVTPK